MKILFILPWLPYPMLSGGHQALFNGIMAIKDDYDVYMAFNVFDEQKYASAKKELIRKIPNVNLIPCIRKKLFFKTILSYLKNKIGTFFSYESDEIVSLSKAWIKTISPLDITWQKHIQHICEHTQFDIIQVEIPYMLPSILSLPKSIKRVFVHHELGFVRRELELSAHADNAYLKACKMFVDYNEIEQCNMYDAIITLSSVDTEKLKQKGVYVPIKTSFAVIESTNNGCYELGDGKCLVFIGQDKHTPNIVGINWFLENCWKKIQSFDCSYQLKIIGNWTINNQKIILEKYKNVHFLGFVDNLADALKESIMIVPITIGSGIRMKILEAITNNIPFVSTSIGAEGIPVVDGRDCFIADNPDAFVSAILKLQDKTIQHNFINNASKICNNYSLEALHKNRIEIYDELLKNINC